MKWIIDRIENGIAICEYGAGKTADIPLCAIPGGAKEGDVITLTIDKNETENRKSNINNLMNSLFED